MSDVFEKLQSAVADRYVIERELGAGSTSTSYLAEDPKLHRQVALKVLRPELCAALDIDRFLRELEPAASLHHPNILPLYDCGEVEGLLFYTVPFVDAETLRDRLRREKQLATNAAVRIARNVAEALGHAHGHHIVHRDLKPEHVRLDGPRGIVTNLGVGRAIFMAGGEHLARTRLATGTPSYMSPEQAPGASDVDGRADVYALGCVLYEMLAGSPAYASRTHDTVATERRVDGIPSVRNARSDVPETVDVAIRKALDPAPGERFATAEDFAKALTDSPAARDLKWRPWAGGGR